jgi:hypothetical protein
LIGRGVRANLECARRINFWPTTFHDDPLSSYERPRHGLLRQFLCTQVNDPSLPLVDSIPPQVPPGDYRAATDFYNAISTLIEDLQKFQEDLLIIHNILMNLPTTNLSERFPSPEVSRARISELQMQ